jgi:MraZ protein
MHRTATHNYIGRYYHALEQKGRLSIPSSFRSLLGATVIVTAGLDGCLFLLDINQWQSLLATTNDRPLTQRQNRDWTRYLANNASQVDLDNQGRILIPEHLRQLANLKTSVVIVGSVDRIEIWNQTDYHAYLDKLNPHIEDIIESITQQPQTNLI